MNFHFIVITCALSNFLLGNNAAPYTVQMLAPAGIPCTVTQYKQLLPGDILEIVKKMSIILYPNLFTSIHQPTDKLTEGHILGIWSISLTPDGKRTLTGSSDETARVRNLHDLHTINSYAREGHTDDIWPTSITDYNWALTGSWDMTARRWPINLMGMQIYILQGFSYLTARWP